MANYMLELREIVGHRPLIQCGTSVVIRYENKILLQLRRDNNKWGLPGGSVEIGERVEEAATREVKEETGLEIHSNNLKLFGVFSGEGQHYTYPNGDEVYNVVTVFISDKHSGELDLENEESISLQFFELDKIPNEINPPDVEIIGKYISDVWIKIRG